METSTTPKSTSLFLQITENPDGTITRPTLPLADPSTSPPVLSKDLIINPSTQTSARLFLPNPNPNPNPNKLPILIFLHSGVFVLFSPSSLPYHHFSNLLSLSLPALILSLDYRKSPENRLPAAYADATEALNWLHSTSEPWITQHADLSKIFLAGSSSGGNIAYHPAGLQAEGLKLKGVIMIQP